MTDQPQPLPGRTVEMDIAKVETMNFFGKVAIARATQQLPMTSLLTLHTLDILLLTKYEPELADWLFETLSKGVTSEEDDRREAETFGAHLAAIRSKWARP